MEEALKEALLRSADVLSDVLRAGLLARGLDADLSVRAHEGGVTVVSRSRAVCAAELGGPGRAPSAPVAAIAASASDDIVSALRGHLREALR